MFKELKQCRVCENDNLIEILDLGMQTLSGTFPKKQGEMIPRSPLSLVKCFDKNAQEHCGLVQLKHTYNLSELYGDNYGYRSSLNSAMVLHLKKKIQKILDMKILESNDFIIDIGSNDGTTLNNYPEDEFKLIGVDPTGMIFKKYYSSHISLIPDFFSASIVKQYFPNIQAKIITSFSMFYDLEEPMKFMQEIKEILHNNGVWVFEQSYLPLMIEKNSYDTICHEHLEYYGLTQIQWMCKKVGFKIIDVEFNDINGGSFSCMVTHSSSPRVPNTNTVNQILEQEKNLCLEQLDPYQRFAKNVLERSLEFKTFLDEARRLGKKVCGLGASTKGNVILQYAGITSQEIEYIGEINQDKFGAYTPGTHIPIVPEHELLDSEMDYYVVLPWHFKQYFLEQAKYKKIKDKLIFPLPYLMNAHGQKILSQ